MATQTIPTTAITRGGTGTHRGVTGLRSGVGRVQLVSDVTIRWDHAASIAFVDVPLAMIATALLGLWWAWIPLGVVAALAWRGWRWSALLAMNQGMIGWCWANVGTRWLMTYPNEMAEVGAVWTMFPLAVAVMAYRNRSKDA